MELNDPLGQFEEYFSNNNDTIQAKSNFTSFGLNGDDVFTSAVNGSYQFVIGGEGNDTYIINSPGVMTIFDNANSSNDIVEASGLDVYSLSTFFGTDQQQKFNSFQRIIYKNEKWGIKRNAIITFWKQLATTSTTTI